jgi:hypothetical protein
MPVFGQLSKLIVALGVAGGLAGGVMAAQRAALPSADFWIDRGMWVIAAIVLATVVPPLQSAISEFGERGRRKTAELQMTLQPILAGILILLVRDAHANWEKTGVQVFQVKGRLWWKKQVRVARLRLAHVAPSGVKWTKNKGMIGKCWTTREPQSKNLDEHFRAHRALDEFQWNTLPKTVERYGLNFAEFQKLNGKFGLVAVFPLTRGDEYIGCITADMPPECTGGVDEGATLQTLGAAAPSISAVIAPR